ncbi:Mth938-like domain-containing protein [Thioalkalivibrio sp. ALgr1]|uniref:Mth938-like domain-containing protein n=2 Tax=Thioalkalivibrio TaxID=106633 RepID=UPI0003756F70|nr:Mth938-like domain-containing protein [Thioalkalivibrio sp. ALgr1]
MLFSEVTSEETYIVTGYESGAVGINQVGYTRSLIVRPNALQQDWPVDSVDALAVEHLQPVIDHPPEVLLIGTGEVQRFPDRAVWRHLRREGFGVEIMDTAAACRTYNLIMAEGREVAAALIIDGGDRV